MLRRRDRAPEVRDRGDLGAPADDVRELQGRLGAALAGLESLSEGIVVFDPGGETSYRNAAAGRLVGRPFSSLNELSPPTLRSACREALETGNRRDVEVETGGRVIQASALLDRDGATGAGGPVVVLVLRDVTAARRSDRIRRDFVANASHELKTPVASIAALAEALHDATGRDQAALERFVTLLQEESERLARLVGDLLDLSRLEGEAAPPDRVSLSEVLRDEAERLRPRAQDLGLSLDIASLEPVEVLGSKSDLALLAHNLLDNAIHYTASGGTVEVSLRGEEGGAVLSIRDTGMGIASRDLDRIFERFYRADPARSRQTGGTGLGLSIVKHVAEAHRGNVSVQSALGEGSTFTVRLPLAPAHP